MSGVALGLDLGTSGLRAAVVRSDGEAVAQAAAPIPPARRRDAGAWWESVRAALAKLQNEASLANIRKVAVCGTSGTILPVDSAGTPLAPASLYNDFAEAVDVAAIARTAPENSAARGASSPLARAFRWRGLPGLAHVLHEADFLAGRLLGQYGQTDWNNALKSGFDPVNLRWPDWILTHDIDAGVLSTPVAPGSVLGRINPRAAITLGLPPETEIVAGTTDGCAAFLATGAEQDGDGVTSLGTTLTLKQFSAAPIFAPAYGVYSHRLGDRWLAGGASNTGGGALARYFAPDEIAALSEAINPDVPTPLDYYPLPAPGERFPIANEHFSPRDTPRPADDAAFLHGLLEGIARIEALGYQRLAEFGGPPLARVFSVGGGAGNPTWTRIRARVLGVELRGAKSTAAAVGVARLALQARP